MQIKVIYSQEIQAGVKCWLIDQKHNSHCIKNERVRNIISANNYENQCRTYMAHF